MPATISGHGTDSTRKKSLEDDAARDGVGFRRRDGFGWGRRGVRIVFALLAWPRYLVVSSSETAQGGDKEGAVGSL